MDTEQMKLDEDVLGHIRKINAEMFEGDEDFASSLGYPEALANVYSNVYEFELGMAKGTYSALYKGAYGFAPRIPSSWSLADISRRTNRILLETRIKESYREPWEALLDA